MFDPFCVLEAGFFSALLLGCFELMLYGLLHQVEGSLILVLEPVLFGVQELCPCLISQPVVLHLLERQI